jgi:hypothetical protein
MDYLGDKGLVNDWQILGLATFPLTGYHDICCLGPCSSFRAKISDDIRSQPSDFPSPTCHVSSASDSVLPLCSTSSSQYRLPRFGTMEHIPQALQHPGAINELDKRTNRSYIIDSLDPPKKPIVKQVPNYSPSKLPGDVQRFQYRLLLISMCHPTLIHDVIASFTFVRAVEVHVYPLTAITVKTSYFSYYITLLFKEPPFTLFT